MPLAGTDMRVRRALGRVPLVRSTWHLARQIKPLLLDSAARARAEYDAEFARARDPWAFETDPVAGRDRFLRELRMLDAVRGGTRFRRALEIGCAEGMFTELLAPRCEQLLAVDVSPIALERARARRPWEPGVEIREWDLRLDPIPSGLDLIVAESVLDCFCRPAALRAAREKLVAALEPGGYLLVGHPRQGEVSESAWWGRWLIRGGKWIDVFLRRDSRLAAVSTASENMYIDTLFQKV
jgi:SAM-dependent methyltransferase